MSILNDVQILSLSKTIARTPATGSTGVGGISVLSNRLMQASVSEMLPWSKTLFTYATSRINCTVLSWTSPRYLLELLHVIVDPLIASEVSGKVWHIWSSDSAVTGSHSLVSLRHSHVARGSARARVLLFHRFLTKSASHCFPIIHLPGTSP